jgi:hypothetical protein
MSNIDLSEEKPSKTIGRVTSFNLKKSIIHIKDTGEEVRPHINRVMSGEKTSDKVYDLM